MKKSFYILSTLIAFVFIVGSSCSEDEDPDPSYPQEDVLGIWEVISSDDPDFLQCQTGDNKLFTITESEITEGSTNDVGCALGGGATYEYNYVNGNTLDGGLAKYKVTALTETEMTLYATYTNGQDGPYTFNLRKKS